MMPERPSPSTKDLLKDTILTLSFLLGREEKNQIVETAGAKCEQCGAETVRAVKYGPCSVTPGWHCLKCAAFQKGAFPPSWIWDERETLTRERLFGAGYHVVEEIFDGPPLPEEAEKKA